MDNVLILVPTLLHHFSISTKLPNLVCRTVLITIFEMTCSGNVCCWVDAAQTTMQIIPSGNVCLIATLILTCIKKMIPCNVWISVLSDSMVSTLIQPPNIVPLTVLPGGLPTTPLGLAYRSAPQLLLTMQTLLGVSASMLAGKSKTFSPTMRTELVSLHVRLISLLITSQEDVC